MNHLKITIDECPKIKVKKRKQTKKFGKNVKMPNKHPKIVQRLVDKILCGRSFSFRPERTCIKTGASHFGVKTCDSNATWGWDSSKERYFYGYTG